MPPAAARMTPSNDSCGAGEGALAVAEKLALEHVAGHGRAVERNERPAVAPRGAVDRAGEHFLAGAGFAGQEHRDLGLGDPPGDRQQLGHLLGDPEPAVGFERVGRPQSGALLLFAAVAIQSDGGLDQLAHRDGGAPVAEAGFRLDDDLPVGIAMCAAGDDESIAGIVGRGHGGLLVPPASVQASCAAVAARDEGDGLGRACGVKQHVGLAREHVWMPSELNE